MIGLIFLDSFIYAVILLVRKKFILTKISIELFVLISSIVSILMILPLLFYNKSAVFSKKNLSGLKEIYLLLIFILIVGSLNWMLFLYLIKHNELSELVPLNELFIILSSCLLGVVYLNEKIKPINLVGIIGGIISIYFINQ